MHILIASIVIACIACALLLCLFGLFTMTPTAKRIEKGDLRKASRH